MARFSPRLWFPGHGPVARRTTEHPALYAGVCVAVQRSGTDATKNTCASDREIWPISGQRRYLFVVQADGKADGREHAAPPRQSLQLQCFQAAEAPALVSGRCISALFQLSERLEVRMLRERSAGRRWGGLESQ